MRVNYLLAVTGALYLAIGFGLTFAPDELLAAIGAPASPVTAWLVQALGAAFMGFACLNWFNRFTLTQGILGRPILLPNFMFTTVSFWLALGAWRRAPSGFLLGCGVLLGALSVAFGARMFSRNTPSEPGA